MNFLGKMAIDFKIKGERKRGWSDEMILYDIEHSPSKYDAEQIEYAKTILKRGW